MPARSVRIRLISLSADGTLKTCLQQVKCCDYYNAVEVMGFEPTASSMRPKRSSQLSYTPEGVDTIPRWDVAAANQHP